MTDWDRGSDSHNAEPAAGLSRSAFLRGAALTMGASVGGLLLGTGTATAAPGRQPGQSAPTTDGLTATFIGDLTGTAYTGRFRVGGTDLGMPARTPDGRMLFIFGDTYAEDTSAGTFPRAPVGLYSSTTDLNSKVVFDGAVGSDRDPNGAARSLIEYDQIAPRFNHILPSDIITVGGRMVVHVMVIDGDFVDVPRTENWYSDDNGRTWRLGCRIPSQGANAEGFGKWGRMFQQLTWAVSPADGMVYMLSSTFGRDSGIILSRVPQQHILDPRYYQPWGFTQGGGWQWGNPPTPVLGGRFGEMTLRPVDGKWLFTFHASRDDVGDYRVDAMAFDQPTSDLTKAVRTTLLQIAPWDNESVTGVAQLYGGFVIPGSSLNDFHLAVSQWNTGTTTPYHVQQFRFQGLRERFNI